MTSSWTACWPRSAARPTPPSRGPGRSPRSRAGCGPSSKTTPGIAALLQTRDPISPASLALAEAFLAPLRAAGLPGRQAALAFRLIYDYTLGFALSDPTSPGEQRIQDTATRAELHAFLRSLPADRFPALAAVGAYAWADDRDQRFTASLDTLIVGLQATLRPRIRDASQPAQAGPARSARPDDRARTSPPLP
jgi:hypothetical protein